MSNIYNRLISRNSFKLHMFRLYPKMIIPWLRVLQTEIAIICLCIIHAYFAINNKFCPPIDIIYWTRKTSLLNRNQSITLITYKDLLRLRNGFTCYPFILDSVTRHQSYEKVLDNNLVFCIWMFLDNYELILFLVYQYYYVR